MPSMTNRFSDPLDPSNWMPPLRVSSFAPGAICTTLVKLRPFGMRSMTSAVRLAVVAFCLTSMIGDSAVTWTSSVRPTAKSKLIFNTWPSSSSTFSNAAFLNPGSMALTVYLPGASALNRY